MCLEVVLFPNAVEFALYICTSSTVLCRGNKHFRRNSNKYNTIMLSSCMGLSAALLGTLTNEKTLSSGNCKPMTCAILHNSSHVPV